MCQMTIGPPNSPLLDGTFEFVRKIVSDARIENGRIVSDNHMALMNAVRIYHEALLESTAEQKNEPQEEARIFCI